MTPVRVNLQVVQLVSCRWTWTITVSARSKLMTNPSDICWTSVESSERLSNINLRATRSSRAAAANAANRPSSFPQSPWRFKAGCKTHLDCVISADRHSPGSRTQDYLILGAVRRYSSNPPSLPPSPPPLFNQDRLAFHPRWRAGGIYRSALRRQEWAPYSDSDNNSAHDLQVMYRPAAYTAMREEGGK